MKIIGEDDSNMLNPTDDSKNLHAKKTYQIGLEYINVSTRIEKCYLLTLFNTFYSWFFN